MGEHAFSAAEQRAVYRAIAERRDMRRFVAGASVSEERQRTAAALGPRADETLGLKVEGVQECAEPVAILCLGPVPDFPDRPALEVDGWTFGRPLAEFVSENGWSNPSVPAVGLPTCPS